uniref:Cadherin domain-containing protein n=1 Tax=Glossina palpalis gambiensis TaxID=67801 RepID=A0A1B0BP99_9MUSC
MHYYKTSADDECRGLIKFVYDLISYLQDAKRGTELDYVIARKNPLFPKPVYLELWGSPLFAIRQKIVSTETTEGTLFLLGPLDFEKQAMYHLTILANVSG